ncbi:MAG: secretin N-terminal domain-containing protein, partial [Planctomycetota bacterium]
NQLPLQGVATDGQTLVNLRFALDFRRNAIVATGSARDLQTVEDLLNRLDAADIQRNETIVYRLSNAPALDIADALTQWVETRQDIITTDPRTNSDVLATNRAINIVPEVVSNSLIVTARPEYKAEIEGIIKALDRRPPMVKVKVLIAEVSLTALEEFGVELGVQDSLLFDRGTIVGANNQITGGIGFPFNQSNAANSNATFSNTLAGQALSNLGLGRINTELGYGGLVLSGGSESVSVLVRALRDRQCVRVLSKPHIMTLENLQGRVSIGAEVPRVSGTSQTNFGVTQDINFVDVGVILEVTPRVSPDGLIVMAVNAQRSRVGGDETGITIGFGANGDPIIAPQIIETEANTTLMARSGQTVVFSGLIQEDKQHAERGAPFLSDLPVIGPLFKFEADSSDRTELLIIMTPYLVTDEADIALLNQDEADRMHWCECDVAEIYGTSESTSHWNTEAATEIYRPVADPTGMQPIQHDIQVDPQIQVPLGKNESTKKPGVRTANFLESKKRR